MPPITTIKQYQNDPYEQYTRKVASAESGGNTTAKNPFGAAGLFQFVPSTWRALNEKYNLGYSQDDRLDPEKSKKVMKLFTEDNKKQLSKRLGRQPDDYELYLAHGFGAAGAGRLIEGLNKNPNTTTEQFFSPIILKQNRALLYNKDGSPKTLADVGNHFKQKMNIPPTKYSNSEKEITPQETVENLREVNNRLTDLVFTKELPNFGGISYTPQEDEDIKKLEEKQVEKEVIREKEIIAQQQASQQQNQEPLQEDIAQYYTDPNQTYEEIDSFLQMQQGGTLYVDNPSDPRYQPYRDSLYLYEENNALKKEIQNNPLIYMSGIRNVNNSNNNKVFDLSIKEDENGRQIGGIKPISRTTFASTVANPIEGRPDIKTQISIGNYKKPEQPVLVKNKAGYDAQLNLTRQQRDVQKTVSKVEEQGVTQVYNNATPKASPEIIQYAQTPNSFSLSEYNQRMNGSQGYGSGRQDSEADLEKALRALEYQDRYNQDIERRYNNPEAQNNPKAQERYNTLRNYLDIQPNYQIGGEIPTSPLGMWQYPNQMVRVPSGNITMKGIDHKILGVSEQTGERKIMYPNENYLFDNTKTVVEIPLKQQGGSINHSEFPPGIWLPEIPVSNVSSFLQNLESMNGNNNNSNFYLNENSKDYKYWKERDAYFNPKRVRGIKTDDMAVNFLYRNDWLLNTPLVGNIIKKAAEKVSKSNYGSATIGAPTVNLADNVLGRKESNYEGNLDNNRPNLINQYFSKNAILPNSQYSPKSDYLTFLPSYSIKGDFENRINTEDYNEIFKEAIERDVFRDVDYNNFLNDKKPVYSPQTERSVLSETLGVDLGGHKLGVAWDEEVGRPYMSISDSWDFEPTHYAKKWTRNSKSTKVDEQKAYIQSYLMHKSGNPFKIYDRFYFDPKTKEYITDENIKKLRKR